MDDDEINGAINGERDDDVIFNDDKINDDTYGADGTGGSNDNWIQPVNKMRLNDDMVDSNEFDDDMVSSRRSISSVDSSVDQLQDDDNNFNSGSATDDAYGNDGTTDDAVAATGFRRRHRHHRNLRTNGGLLVDLEESSLLRRWF